MSFPYGNLVTLHRRLQRISEISIGDDHPVKLEDFEIDSTKPRYVCAECAWTTSTNAGKLARHFTTKHISRLKCPDCKNFFANELDLDNHWSEKHRNLCLSCQRFFPTVNECKHHEPCESQHRIVPTIGSGALSHTVIDQPVREKAPASGQSILNRSGSIQSGSCPDPGCQATFSDFDTLYEHYVGSHPLCIVYRGHPKPFKCPFCLKRYQHDRFIPGHVRAHKPKSLKTLGPGVAEDQEALIRQSHVAMANQRSQLHVEAQAQADSTSIEEEETLTPIKGEEEEEEEESLFLRGGVVYLEEGVKTENSSLEQSDQLDLQESQRFGEMMPIGLIVQGSSTDLPNFHPTHETPFIKTTPQNSNAEAGLSGSMDLDDGYPDRYALDDHELPSRMGNPNSSVIATQLIDEIVHHFHQNFSREIVRALHMQHFINVSEVVDLFNYFLDKDQREYVLEQLATINLNQHDSGILEALHGTVFKALIDAWVDFKRLAIRFAPQLIVQANDERIGSGKSVTWALLQYCLNLEKLIYRNEINIAHHFLRDAPLDELVIQQDAPFSRLVAALAERVKNRTVHDLAMVFTNEMVLRGMSDYVRILQMIFRPLYPLAAGHEQLWRELRLI